jgi:hypothetical protein
MRTRLVAVAAAAGVVAAVMPAHAAGPRPQVVDPTGDANGLNDQGTGSGSPPSMATAPADVAAADIVSVQFVTNFVTKVVKRKKVKVANGFTVTMTLAAAPTTDIEYRVSGAAADCSSVFFEYDTAPGPTGGSDTRCPGSTPTSDIDYGVGAKASGNKITWVVPNGVFHNGTVFSSLNAQTRSVVGIITAPQIDYAESTATFTVGK